MNAQERRVRERLDGLERRIREVCTEETDTKLLRVRIENELREEHNALLMLLRLKAGGRPVAS